MKLQDKIMIKFNTQEDISQDTSGNYKVLTDGAAWSPKNSQKRMTDKHDMALNDMSWLDIL